MASTDSAKVFIPNPRYDSSCEIHLFGATVVSWKCEGEELLFVSSKTDTGPKPTKAVRGGIPIVFPNFGPWEHGPQHGFARNQWWTVDEEPAELPNGNMMAVFKLTDNAETRALWNHSFTLLYTLTLGEELSTELEIENTGDTEFDFTCLLHNYFRVPDISKVTVSGLQYLQYIDKVKGGEELQEEEDLVTITKNVDRVYKSAKDDHVIDGGPNGRVFTLKKSNLEDTVLWNPWAEKAAGMSDFGDEEYKQMICVEAGHVTKRFILKPNEMFTCSQTLEISPI